MARSSEKGHGRLEKRMLRTTPHLTLSQNWKGMKQAFEITRERTIGGKTTVEVEYGITSLSAEAANAQRLLDAVRDHWLIENGLHYVRDGSFKEDACRVRKGNAPQVLAALRNALLHLLADFDADSYPEAIEILQIHPEQAKQLIGIPNCE